MNLRLFTLSAVVFLSSLTILAQTPSDATRKGSTLQVHVNYTGSGPVDQTHKIYVALWDSPDFVKDTTDPMPPFATAPLTSKSGAVTFQDVKKNPVYVSMAYDPTGNWNGDSEPPVGTSLGLFSKGSGTPAPVQLEPGKTTKISVTLDDSFKKQQMSKRP